MSHRRRYRYSTAVIGLGAIFCLLAVMIVGVMLSINAYVERKFGEADQNLPIHQSVLLSIKLLLSEKSLLVPVDPLSEPVDFTIASGENVISIAERLEENGIIRDADSFITYLIYKGYDSSIQAGDFLLPPSHSAAAIAHILQQASNAKVKFTVFPGWRMEEVAAAIAVSGLNITENEIIDIVKHNYMDYLPPFAGDLSSLEGTLSPGLYSFDRTLTSGEIVSEMVSRFEKGTSQDVLDGIERQGLSFREAIILASIIERESVVDDEMTLISSVFFNRLRSGMRLESDPTVQYAIGYIREENSWWKNPLSLNDLKVGSPYNTYQNIGLPPGPICNPSQGALSAVAQPEESAYFFFRASCDGSGTHQFAETFEEHLSNACP